MMSTGFLAFAIVFPAFLGVDEKPLASKPKSSENRRSELRHISYGCCFARLPKSPTGAISTP